MRTTCIFNCDSMPLVLKTELKARIRSALSLAMKYYAEGRKSFRFGFDERAEQWFLHRLRTAVSFLSRSGHEIVFWLLGFTLLFLQLPIANATPRAAKENCRAARFAASSLESDVGRGLGVPSEGRRVVGKGRWVVLLTVFLGR